MPSISLPAPAKINLFLHVLGKRADGYHELQTLFQLLDYGDTLTFSAHSNLRLTTTNPVLANNDNLIMQVAKALQTASHCSEGVHIHLDKILPMGGGIGGGSSDAATTLLALNQLWGCKLSIEQLCDIGKQYGADIPVFIQGHTAWAEGIGEKLQPIDIPSKWYIVLTPDCEISTAQIFGHSELTRDTPPITVAAFFEQGARNDCQPLVEKLFPSVAESVNWLKNHPANASGSARMTGTGASVFAAFDDQSTAATVLADSPWKGFVARGVNRSSVHSLLSSAILP
ncbi:MAG: 4-(cytidine 5'-diphospho)-2-C-methyl-D-erythritol kinase [Cellvibrionaceae bacterium]